ncbi:response regulator [Pedobacter aquatilis]|uniref:response regulator n=1 Tax=Pedobacter aquatilis TaxID=351343 RepID=UPI0025B4916A|nr:response regulator [Pedobacter aquatilis]MDN3586004.1 response regulator [Pedobacter aquatilis]
MRNEIFLIDDDEYSLFINREIIAEHTNLPIKCFDSGIKGLEYLQNEQNVGCVWLFLDLNMPQMNGWDVLEALSSLDTEIQMEVYILSSSVDVKDRERSRNYPMVQDYILKPLDSEVAKGILSA